MPSRRELLTTAAMLGAATLVRPLNSVFAKASQPSTPVKFDVPAGACDTHSHIFGDPMKFPLAPDRTYTPEVTTIEEMRQLHRALHLSRVVIVTPSAYAADNSCTLDAIRQLGAGARGIAVIDDKTTDAALDQMSRGGIRGLRLNLIRSSPDAVESTRAQLQSVVRRIGTRKWHVQMFTNLAMIEAIREQVMAAPVPIVFDHFGSADAALGVQQPGFQTLLKMVSSGKAYVKVSAPYRVSQKAPDYPDVAPLARALVSANPERILWATDWPHIAGASDPKVVSPPRKVDDGLSLNQLADWVPDAAQRKLILVDNPARLYGF